MKTLHLHKVPHWTGIASHWCCPSLHRQWGPRRCCQEEERESHNSSNDCGSSVKKSICTKVIISSWTPQVEDGFHPIVANSHSFNHQSLPSLIVPPGPITVECLNNCGNNIINPPSNVPLSLRNGPEKDKKHESDTHSTTSVGININITTDGVQPTSSATDAATNHNCSPLASGCYATMTTTHTQQWWHSCKMASVANMFSKKVVAIYCTK